MRRVRIHSFVVVGITCLAFAPGAYATDGVLELNQVAALAGNVTSGDAPGFPIELFTGGSYRLTSDLVVPSGAEAGIAVYASGVRIDLNGFAIRSGTSCSGTPPSCAPTGTGIGIDASGASDVAVRNGRIAGFGVYGLSLLDGGRITDLGVDGNGLGGIVCDAACIVTTSSVRRNGGPGITVGAGSRVSESTIVGNAGAGISGPADVLSDRNVTTQNGAGSPLLRSRRFYRTAASVPGNVANGTCSAGFHLASLWEILDPSGLSYDRQLGVVDPTAGAGPPSGNAAVGSYGWIRGGNQNCSNWSSTTSSGHAVALESNWAANGAVTWPWSTAAFACSESHPVWCVED